jgi:serine/threonine-protein kinase RsbT
MIEVPINDAGALTEMRRLVSDAARTLGFGLVETTKLLTAANELGHNIVTHANDGRMTIESVEKDRSVGLRLGFLDNGPGISDINQAMQDGYTSGKGRGMGLSGTRRLMHEFKIESEPGKGSQVYVTMWKR